jgi:Bifunctional DNA primase/polymerase, N-terminal
VAKQIMTILDDALSYIERGWEPVPVGYRKKGPVIKGWGDAFKVTTANAAQYFNGEPSNIGVVLGLRSGGLTDADSELPGCSGRRQASLHKLQGRRDLICI